MQGYTVHPLEGAPAINVVREMPRLAPSIEAEIEHLWQSAQRRLQGVLFNGRVFSADAMTPRRIDGHFTEFRRIVAQMAWPELNAELQLRPLAVNGIVRLADGILLGQRSHLTAYQAGMWQLPPAGSVDPGAADGAGRIDLTAQLLRELAEETGIVAERSAVAEPLCIVEHPFSHVLDIGMPVVLSLPGAALFSCEGIGNGEYEKLLVVPEAELPAQLTALGSRVVPSALIFLARLGLLR